MTAPWCLIPVKRLEQAKQRLAPLLDPDERARLARAMALDVIEAATRASTLAGVAVITADAEVTAQARRAGARIIADRAEAGTCAAVAEGARILAEDGAAGILVLAADLPQVMPEDLDHVVVRHGAAPAVSLVPAAADRGTNLLACSPVQAIPFLYGPDSFHYHVQAARACGITPRVLDLPRLVRDIDRPGDLSAFLAQGGPPSRSRTLLKALPGAIWRFAEAPPGVSRADPTPTRLPA
ncbi:2-phospho-L-lactate guanylyltransferase [Methylobacterium organophilum]|uniref:2-phospho-L-lactate guanylyltransferase n=1 Tax=Methylobacterium organophilum TaxID=410 RepID=UPI001F12F2CD|nr:2-phospho-L-lactate guanylyltransferase [Methylobacterium organophilum]UMY16328.1 2-phospho-L-lactate guanylyltransferase [Methylobacterium organophilum]